MGTFGKRPFLGKGKYLIDKIGEPIREEPIYQLLEREVQRVEAEEKQEDYERYED